MHKLKVENNKIKLGKDYFYSNTKTDLEEELYTAYAEILATGEASTPSFLGKLLNRNFKKMEANETYNAIQAINTLERIAGDTFNYFNKKKEGDIDYTYYLLDKSLMPWQKEVLKDLAKRIILLAGRRAGKTYEIATHLVNHCVPGYDEFNGVKKFREAIYIGLTVEKAAAVIWDILLKVVEGSKMPYTKNQSTYSIDFSNGARIQLLGNNSKADREKIRGFDSSMFVIDECQSQQGLLYLVNSIISPILKGRNGLLMLSGTGPLSAGTFWEDAILSGTYSIHKATMQDNITIPNYENALEEVLKENHWTEDNITFRREYLGQIAYDTNLLVYPFRKYYEDLPKAQWKECYIGVDFGFVDCTAIAPILVDTEDNMYLVKAFKKPGMSASDIVSELKSTVDFVSTKFGLDKTKIKIITDTNEQNIDRDFYNAGIYNIQLAYKQNQKYQIALVRDSLESGTLKIKKDDEFDLECNRLVWKWDSEKGCVIYELDDNTFHGDICDAVQYAVATWYSDNIKDK